ncbi:MAG: YajG family lipoprotein [Pseudomonadota bacterium]
MRSLKSAAIALFAVLLPACTLSPQTIHVTPQLVIAPAAIGNGKTVSVQVIDERSDTVLGSRGGVYSKSSLIRSGNDIAEAVRLETEKGLAAQGYAVDNSLGNSSKATAAVKIVIAELSYVVPEGPVATGADMTAALRVTAEDAGGTHTANYRSTVTRKFPVAPTAGQNETWINEVLGETLARFFADQQMRAFLTR